MKLVHMVGAGVLTVAGGMLLAWSLDDRSVEASVENRNDQMTAVTDVDPARQAALSTFDQFWNRVSADKTGLDAISIKVAIPHQDGFQHLWMTGCQSADAQSFACIVSNEAAGGEPKLGSRYDFKRADISDWMYRQQGKIHGGYSIRALLSSMPADQAEEMTKMLAPLPG